MVSFFKQFLERPSEIGAIAPSSVGLSRLITDTAQVSTKKCVVELGPGTGVVTKEILPKISSKCTFFSIEINPRFVEETKKNCPDAIVYHGSAKKMRRYLSKHHATTCDCIISCLPWVSFNQKEQEELLHIIYDSLETGGEFLTFAYLHGVLLPGGMRFKRLLNEQFAHVEKTKTVWKNLPPAFVYHCKK